MASAGATAIGDRSTKISAADEHARTITASIARRNDRRPIQESSACPIRMRRCRRAWADRRPPPRIIGAFGPRADHVPPQDFASLVNWDHVDELYQAAAR